MSLDHAGYRYVRSLVLERTAVVLEADKNPLIDAHLASLATRSGLGGERAMLERLRRDRFGELHRSMIEALTMSETSFFRDCGTFELIGEQLLPALIDGARAERELHFWSAACASGQEPYSLAMLLEDRAAQLAGWQLRIHASDSSPESLARAVCAEYAQPEVNRGLPAAKLVEYFEQTPRRWRVADRVRRHVAFREIDLTRPFPPLPPMDLVLLRNVLLYFSEQTRRGILDRVRDLVEPNGYLVLGAKETGADLHPRFEPASSAQAGVYRPV